MLYLTEYSMMQAARTTQAARTWFHSDLWLCLDNVQHHSQTYVYRRLHVHVHGLNDVVFVLDLVRLCEIGSCIPSRSDAQPRPVPLMLKRLA